MSSLIRQLKLYALVGKKAPSDTRAALIIEYFDKLFDGMIVEVIPDYDKDSVIYHKGGEFYMEQDFKNDRLWCRRDGYWSFLEKDMELGYDETQAVIKYMVEKHIKYHFGTPMSSSVTVLLRWRSISYTISEHLPRGWDIISKRWRSISNNRSEHQNFIRHAKTQRVEKHIKQQVGTPGPPLWPRALKVEKHIKQQVGTPYAMRLLKLIVVEKHIKQQPCGFSFAGSGMVEKHPKQQNPQ